MNVLRLLPIIFSFLLLAAHFSRANLMPLSLIALLFPLILLIRRSWVPKLVTVVLIAGAVEWIRAMLVYINIRKSIGDDWVRLAIILSVVAILTAVSALVFRNKHVTELFG